MADVPQQGCRSACQMHSSQALAINLMSSIIKTRVLVIPCIFVSPKKNSAAGPGITPVLLV